MFPFIFGSDNDSQNHRFDTNFDEINDNCEMLVPDKQIIDLALQLLIIYGDSI